MNLQSESKFFVEKQTLDLNTTTQTTSRNNESLTLKKKDSELLGYQSRTIDNPNFPIRKITRNVSDINCAAIMRKKEFMKNLLDRQIEKNQNKSEVVKPVNGSVKESTSLEKSTSDSPEVEAEASSS